MKYDRHSIRLQKYNYSKPGYYFVTICTKNKKLFFDNEKLKVCAKNFWLNIPNKFQNIELGEWIIMPNHIHGIIIIIKGVGAIHELPLQRRKMLLPKIIGYFKMNSAKGVNILLNRKGIPFWQRNYYEHVIRNEKSLNSIREYIINNPTRWEEDLENPKNRKLWKEIKKEYNSLFSE